MKLSESLGANQPIPVAARISLLNHREQTTLAAQLAATSLDLDNRNFSRDTIRNSFVANSLKHGDTQSALSAYRSDHAGIFEVPVQINLEQSSWGVGSLIEIAMIKKSGGLVSGEVDEILQAAQSILEGTHPSVAPWLADINWAALENVRGNTKAALQHLRDAVGHGFRFNWRHTFEHWFVLENLHDEPEYKSLIALLEEDMDRQREEAYVLLGMTR
jgi:hypothetical protein